mmetsp:Transcript_32613/g.64817  ORF Transcript_32613/g.64817 Transcript_32613/m.64817 type:complete len:85 (+) Transcript_32613:665-919(+)
MTATFDLNLVNPTLLISTPSILIDPESSSTIRSRAVINVLLPAPVLPTTPTLLRAGMESSSPFRTKGKPGRYLSLTSKNSIFPD